MKRSVISLSGPPLDDATTDALAAMGHTLDCVSIEQNGWDSISGCWAHVLGGSETLDREQVAALPDSIKVVCFLGTGFESYMDAGALEERGIVACYTPHANARSTAEFALGLLIMGLRGVPVGIGQVQRNEWNPPQGRSLVNATVGVVGFGHVGREIVRMLSTAFGITPLVWNRTERDADIRRAGGQPTSLHDVFSVCDAVTLHANASDGGEPLITGDLLRLASQQMVIVNTARAGVVDHDALRAAFVEKPGLRVLADVYPDEPVGPASDELGLLDLGIERFLLTPHMAYASDDSVRQMGEMVVANLVACAAGTPVPFPASAQAPQT